MSTIILDQAVYPQKDGLLPFALTDVLIDACNETKTPFLHFWQLEKSFILGMKDTRAVNLSAGLQTTLKAGYEPIVRNSGGLGVLSDAGILNLSLILPNHEKTLTTDQAYQKMLRLTQKALPHLAIQAHEVPDSYCPGKFDFTASGKKIAGTAQRRVKDAVAVMMYLSVSGNQKQRGEIVRNYYQHSLNDYVFQSEYPIINPASMTSLSEISSTPLSLPAIKTQFINALNEQYQQENSTQWLLTNQKLPQLKNKLDKMIQRNQPIKELLHAKLI
ncbi:MAG: biotin/lipoate A/B protein ligase family protein [Enterococcus sp.]